MRTSKIFDGKVYYLADWVYTRKDADEIAKTFRSFGHSVQIVVNREGDYKAYFIYHREQLPS